MAKLSSTHIYGDLYVDGTISGALSGNASTATTLQTARTINGTSFNGSANITTANWGTSRTITIGNTGKSVNGSGNVSWTLAEIGAAASSHGTHLTLGTGSGNAYRGDYGNTAYTHSQAAHAPSNAQKNSDITKAEIEAKLTGTITSHNHSGTYAPASHNHTSLTGVTSLTFAANSDDSSIIQITKDSANSYTDFIMSDDAGTDMWRWRFKAWDSAASATTAEFNLMTLKATSTTKGQLSVNGNVTADSFTEGGTALSSKYAAASHGTHLTIGTGASNAAAGNHTHSYLPLSGGTMTGKISGGAMTGTWVAAAGGSSFINSTAGAGNFHPMLSAKTTNGGMTLAFYQNALQVGYLTKANIDSSTNTLAKNAILMDESGNGTWPGTVSAVTLKENGTALADKYAAKSHGTHLTIGTGSGNAAAGNHTHNAIVSRGSVTAESGVAGRPAVSGLSMSEVYSNGYPTPYGNVISLRGMGDGQLLIGWSGTDGAHAPVYVRSKRDNTATANWSGWAQVYTTAHKPTAADIGALPLSGGTLTGTLSISGNSKTLTIGTGGSDVYMTNSASGKYLQLKDNGNLTYHDDIILHGANYKSYALPLSGGTVTGNLVVNGNIATKTGAFTYAKDIGVATSDGSTFLALFRYANNRGYCDLGTNSIPGRLYIRSGQGTAGSGVCVECAVTNGTAYVQYLSPEAGTIALTKHLSDRTKKDNIVYVGSENSEFTNKDFYDFIKNDLGLATYTIKEEYATTDTHTKLNFIAQDILYDYDNDCINKVGNLIVQAEDAMEQQGTLQFDPDTFASVIAGALKESINKIEELEDKNEKLEERLAMLEEKFSALENK